MRGSAMRLAKYLAHAGVASRRAAEQLIARRARHRRRRGRDAIRRATSTRQRASPSTASRSRGAERARRLRAEQAAGRGLDRAATRTAARRSSTSSPTERRLYPVGRLDADTDRADPADQRRRARQPPDAPALRGAQDLPRHRSAAAACSEPRAAPAARGRRARRRPDRAGEACAGSRPTQLELTIHEGRKRQVERMCEAVGHRVLALERIALRPAAPRELGAGDARGDARSAAEVERARRGRARSARRGAGSDRMPRAMRLLRPARRHHRRAATTPRRSSTRPRS